MIGVSVSHECGMDPVDLCLLFWECYEDHGMMRLSPQKLPKVSTTAKGVSGELLHTKENEMKGGSGKAHPCTIGECAAR